MVVGGGVVAPTRIQLSMVTWRLVGLASGSCGGDCRCLRRVSCVLCCDEDGASLWGGLLGALERCRLGGGASCGEDGRCLRLASKAEQELAMSEEDDEEAAKGTGSLGELEMPVCRRCVSSVLG